MTEDEIYEWMVQQLYESAPYLEPFLDSYDCLSYNLLAKAAYDRDRSQNFEALQSMAHEIVGEYKRDSGNPNL